MSWRLLGSYRIEDEQGREVVTVQENDLFTCSEHMEHARLIASAPALLEALKEAEKVLWIMRFPATSKAHNTLLSVQEVIEKAGG